LSESRFSGALRRAAHPIYRRLETTVHPLRYLFLEITQRCNLNCLHCGSDCGRQARPGELTTDEWIDFIHYLGARFKKKKELFLVITGGEPLCHPKLPGILDAINEHGFPYGMVTNGYLLGDRTVATLVDRGISSITVSLDGMRDSHDWLRGVPGSFDRAVAGLRILAKQPIRFLDVVTCANPRNLSQLPAVLEILQNTGVRRWRIFSIFPKGRAKDNEELLLTDEQLVELLDWIRDTRIKLEGTGFTLDFSCEGYLPAAVDHAVRNEPYFCRAGICIGSVLCDGAICACPNITRDLVQGNIRDDDFLTVWEERFERFRNREWMKTDNCIDCGEWNRCKGNSLHLWDNDEKRTVLCYHRILLKNKSCAV
jgi:radical SAM enzyme (rSAM/lipoprotein system)